MSNAAIVPTVAPGQRLNVSKVDNTLSIANGMTAGYGVQDGNSDNWPVDPTGKLYGGNHGWSGSPYGNVTRIGFIRNSFAIGANSNNNDGQYTLYFMFNPNQISIQWQTNPQAGSPLYLYGQDLSSQNAGAATTGQADSSQVPSYATAQTVGWSLYFDRTYDMLYGADAGSNSPQNDRGVLKDVAALYNLMGTFVAGSSGAAVPFSTPCEVVFGQNGAGQLFGFTGYISSMTINYGIFRHDMIPSRAEVDLTLTATYVTNQVNATGGGQNPTGPNANNPSGVSSPNKGITNYYGSNGSNQPTPQGPPPTIARTFTPNK